MYDPLSASVMNTVFKEIFGPKLAVEGFEPVAPRKWVRSKKKSIREVFEVTAMKGASYSPRWGVSLDFVPHFSGSSLRWHRTPKSSILDLCFDPCDYDNPFPDLVCSLFGLDVAKASGMKQADYAIPLALGWFHSIQDITDLVREYEAAKQRRAVRFGFYNYVQHPLAFALVLARVGRLEAARAELRRFLQTPSLAKHTTKLEKLLEENSADGPACQ